MIQVRSLAAVALLACLLIAPAGAQDSRSDKLILTGGLSQIEGAAGGGLVPWALIGGYGTEDQWGASAFYTHANSADYGLNVGGVLVGINDRVELSLARQEFDTADVGAALGLGRGFAFQQTIFGIKVKLLGDAVLEQDSWMPQLALGVQHKRNDSGAVLRTLGARSDTGTDVYLSATKLYLAPSVLLNATLRLTKANQLGLLGFGGDRRNAYQPQFEASAALLLQRNLAVGIEYRSKPDNLRFAREQDWFDGFITWAPSKNLALTLAYVRLGDVASIDDQRATYLSTQVGF